MAKQNSITHRLYTGEISYNFYDHRKLWYTVSSVILLICVASIFIFKLQLGIEFRGGSEFSATVPVTANTVEDFRGVVSDLGLPDMGDISATTVGDSEVRIQTRPLTTEEVTEVRQAIAQKAGITSEEVSNSFIGASWGSQITSQALIALVVFLALVMALIWAYFRDFKMGIAAILALLHDLVITIGVYSIVGFSVTPATLIGVLTILGYSLYDTVVVFDKVRENVHDLFNGRESYASQANKAVNQVLVRSINTTIIGVLPVAALTFTGTFILGTGPLKDLGLALLVGMVVGAYSSIFIATPLLIDMREREPEMKEHRLRIKRREQRRALKQAGVAEEKPAAETILLDSGTHAVDVDELAVVSAAELQGRQQPSRKTRSQRKGS